MCRYQENPTDLAVLSSLRTPDIQRKEPKQKKVKEAANAGLIGHFRSDHLRERLGVSPHGEGLGHGPRPQNRRRPGGHIVPGPHVLCNPSGGGRIAQWSKKQNSKSEYARITNHIQYQGGTQQKKITTETLGVL